MIIWALLLVLVTILALLLHRMLGVAWSALVAAFITAGSLQLLTRIRLGYFDPLWPIAAATSFAMCAAAAAVMLYVTDRLKSHPRAK